MSMTKTLCAAVLAAIAGSSGPAWSNQMSRSVHSAPAIHAGAPVAHTSSVPRIKAAPMRQGPVAGWRMASAQTSQGSQAIGSQVGRWQHAQWHRGDGDHDGDDHFGHEHRHHRHVLVIIGAPFFPPPVFEPTIAVPADGSAYIDPFTPPGMAPGYWYYCDDPQGYYPYVGDCPNGWQQVTPQPPQ